MTLGKLTPLVQMIQMEQEAVALYVRYLKGILTKDLQAAASKEALVALGGVHKQLQEDHAAVLERLAAAEKALERLKDAESELARLQELKDLLEQHRDAAARAAELQVEVETLQRDKLSEESRVKPCL